MPPHSGTNCVAGRRPGIRRRGTSPSRRRSRPHAPQLAASASGRCTRRRSRSRRRRRRCRSRRSVLVVVEVLRTLPSQSSRPLLHAHSSPRHSAPSQQSWFFSHRWPTFLQAASAVSPSPDQRQRPAGRPGDRQGFGAAATGRQDRARISSVPHPSASLLVAIAPSGAGAALSKSARKSTPLPQLACRCPARRTGGQQGPTSLHVRWPHPRLVPLRQSLSWRTAGRLSGSGSARRPALRPGATFASASQFGDLPGRPTRSVGQQTGDGHRRRRPAAKIHGPEADLGLASWSSSRSLLVPDSPPGHRSPRRLATAPGRALPLSGAAHNPSR